MSAPGIPQTAATIVAAVRSGEISAVEVVDQCLKRIEENNDYLNAFTDVTAARAVSQARAIDKKIARGLDPGPLAGAPFAVKNLFDVAGLSTLAGSKINRDRPPASEDAVVIQRLTMNGAVLVGALNMGEYAYDFTGENAHYGPSRNPRDPLRISGGSSGGCGTAVGAGMVPVALGSDTNGSIRVPASLCGVFGLKPTYGRLTRRGAFAFCPSLDHVGPLAKSTADIALFYDAMQGPDAGDPVCSDRPTEGTSRYLGESSPSLRVARSVGNFVDQGTPDAHWAIARVSQVLGVTEEVEIEGMEAARAAAYIMTNAESSSLHLKELRKRAADYDPDVRDRMLAGALLPADWYIRAQKFRHWYRERVREVFARYDIVLAPATPMTAPLIGQRTMALGGEDVLVRPHLGLYTQPWSFVGLPVVVVPVELPSGLPIGVQIVAAPWREVDALRLAYVWEREGLKRYGN